MTGDDNWPVSEKYRLKGLDWVRLDSAASLLEELKTAFLSKKKQVLVLRESMSDARAEMLVKASPEWTEYIRSMVTAREAANSARVETESERMRHGEQMSAEATARAERRM